MNKILVIVHPGSACGSADMNLGRDEACRQRLDMQLLVQGWEGGVLVIDGELSDELEQGRPSHVEWGQAIKGALARAAEAGLVSERMRGDDAEEFHQEAAMAALLEKHALTPESAEFGLTGAWYESNTGGGCVGGVHQMLVDLGYAANIELDGVMDLDIVPEYEDDLDLDMEEDGEEADEGEELEFAALQFDGDYANIAGLKKPQNSWAMLGASGPGDVDMFESGSMDGSVFLLSEEQDAALLAKVAVSVQDDLAGRGVAVAREGADVILARWTVPGGGALWITGDTSGAGHDEGLARLVEEGGCLDCVTAVPHLFVESPEFEEEAGAELLVAIEKIRRMSKRPRP